MQTIRYGFIVLGILLCLATPAVAQVSVGISLPHVSIGINLPLYPELVPVEGYPVYYAPRLNANYFFYDGMYWVYQDDYWYTSDWYNGPWWLVEPEFVPVFILRIPVRYYRSPPRYFYGWPAYAPPRWDRHWGHEWEQRRRGWDRWDRRSVPPPAPRPDYQRRYSGNRYPRVEQQQILHQQHYRYQPRDTMVRERIQPRMERRTPAPAPRIRGQETPQQRSQRQQDVRRETPRPQIAPDHRRTSSSPSWSGSSVRKLQQQPGEVQQRERERQRPRPQDQELIRREQNRDKSQKKGEGKERENNREHDRN